MPSLYLLIPIALILVVIASLLYWWAVRDGQYGDLDREADRILFDDDSEDPAPTAGEQNAVVKKEEQH